MKVSLTKEQSAIIAAHIRPQIKAFIEANKDKYLEWLKAEREAGR